MNVKRQKKVSKSSKAALGRQEPPTYSNDGTPDYQDEDDENLDTMAFVQEIFNAAKQSAEDGGTERYLENIANFLFGETPTEATGSSHPLHLA